MSEDEKREKNKQGEHENEVKEGKENYDETEI